MSAFTKATQSFDAIKARLEAITAPAAAHAAVLDTIVADLRALEPEIVSSFTIVCLSHINERLNIQTKFRNKANETDPDKQLYGPSMIERVKAFAADFDTVYATAIVVHQDATALRAQELAQQRVIEEAARKKADDDREEARMRAEAEAQAEKEAEQAALKAKLAAEAERAQKQREIDDAAFAKKLQDEADALAKQEAEEEELKQLNKVKQEHQNTIITITPPTSQPVPAPTPALQPAAPVWTACWRRLVVLMLIGCA